MRPKPSCDQRRDARPKAMRLRLRMACTATCGSSAQAWMHRSPPLDCRNEGVSGEARERRREAGECATRCRSGRCPWHPEQFGTEAEGDGQAAGRQPLGLTGVVGRRERVAAAPSPTGWPLRHAGGGVGPVRRAATSGRRGWPRTPCRTLRSAGGPVRAS